MVQDMGNTFWFLVHTNLFRATTAGPASAVANGVEPPVDERAVALSMAATGVAIRGPIGGRASITRRVMVPGLPLPLGSRSLE